MAHVQSPAPRGASPHSPPFQGKSSAARRRAGLSGEPIESKHSAFSAGVILSCQLLSRERHLGDLTLSVCAQCSRLAAPPQPAQLPGTDSQKHLSRQRCSSTAQHEMGSIQDHVRGALAKAQGLDDEVRRLRATHQYQHRAYASVPPVLSRADQGVRCRDGERGAGGGGPQAAQGEDEKSVLRRSQLMSRMERQPMQAGCGCPSASTFDSSSAFECVFALCR